FFVDHLAVPGLLDQHTTATVGDFFASAHGRLEEMLHSTSDLLARLTNYAAVVVGPKAEAVAVRTVQIVSLSPTAATVVAVLGNGAVESETIEISASVTEDQVAAAGRLLNAHCSGRPLSWHTLPSSGEHAVDAICALALGALVAGSASEHVYMGGTSAMVSAFDAVDIVRDVLRTLEQQFVIVTLVSDILNRGMSVAIGVEHGVQPLSACSVVVAPVVVDGEHRGSVGVLGPTRMNYPQALATVEVVSERLGQRFEAAEAGANG
ncbi:MAG TPA: HrcA family transcriptional regulator, partial [Desertimonas sp.]|nr:HrcA family transcriptional regulator [Desertimonas sp.]